MKRTGGPRIRSQIQLQVRSTARMRGALWAATFLTIAGCSSDIFDINVALTPEKFPLDFGSGSGTIPSLACDLLQPAMCGGNQVIALMTGTSEADVQVALSMGCDAATMRCYAEANAHANYTVDVLRDESFTSKVGRQAISVVRMLDIAYTIPTNTATFDIPRIDVSVGPPGTTAAADPGAFPVDSIPPLPAGTVVAGAARHFTLADNSPARDLIERNIKNKTPFVFVLTLAPRLESGAPMPAGKVEIAIQPLLGLGVR
jgi:hypothetical protein